MPPRSHRVDHAEKNAVGDTGSATIATVERAADVLLFFCESPRPDVGVTEIAEGLGLSKAAVHRVLASLRGRGFIQLDEGTRRYALGVSAMKLGLAYLERIDVRRVARPYLEMLSKKTNETATLSIPAGPYNRIYVDQITPDREVIMSVTQGIPYPLYAGASSRAFLAFATPERLAEYLAEVSLESLTPGTITDADALRADLEQVRRQGWAHSAAERKSGAASVAAPVFSHDGEPVAVVSVCGPLERFSAEFEECRTALLEVTAELSAQFGWTG